MNCLFITKRLSYDFLFPGMGNILPSNITNVMQSTNCIRGIQNVGECTKSCTCVTKVMQSDKNTPVDIRGVACSLIFESQVKKIFLLWILYAGALHIWEDVCTSTKFL